MKRDTQLNMLIKQIKNGPHDKNFSCKEPDVRIYICVLVLCIVLMVSSFHGFILIAMNNCNNGVSKKICDILIHRNI